MSNDKSVWVEMDVVKEQDVCSTYRGKIDKALLESILENRCTEKFFRLDNIHWLSEEYDEISDKTTIKYFIYGMQGDLMGLEGHSYFRVEDIREVAPLVKDYEETFENAKIHSMIE